MAETWLVVQQLRLFLLRLYPFDLKNAMPRDQSLDFYFDIHACRQVKAHQGINRFRIRL